jgi:ATP-dependent DNA helicase RecQ
MASAAFPRRELPEEELRRVLSAEFGHADFQPHQLEAIRAVLAGTDVLVTMPTGAGKSLIYQFPSVLLDGLTLVISPLIALMKDQVDGLRRKGIRASYVNSSLEARERRRRLDAATRGAFDLLFVTPERFRSGPFLERLEALRVARFAVDEAHCISEWGHDFRPDYWKLGEYRALLGDPPTVALTATATPKVARDIVSSLRLDDPLVVRTGIERPNLFLGCHAVQHAEDKLPHLLDRIRAIDGPGIVYSTLIRDLEALHDELKRRGVSSLVYHGKLSPEERRGMQERFMSSEREVVLATNAFGMGVDKADIRFVLHAQIPRTLEAWTQEVGRAGRDGRPSFCELLYFEEDLAVQQNFIAWANPSREYLLGVYETLRGWGERLQVKDLDDLRDELLVKQRGDNRVSICLKWLEVLGVTRGAFETNDLELARDLDPGELPDFVGAEEKHQADLRALLGMMSFAKDDGTCRRVQLERHFGLAESEGACGACDVCGDGEAWLAQGLAARTAARVEEDAGEESTGYRRGDWVRVGGRHLGHVVRVEGTGARVRLVVESAGDFRRRTVDPRRTPVERLEGEAS